MENFNKLFFVAIAAGTTFYSTAQNFKASVRKFITDTAKITAFVDAKIIDGTGGPSKKNQTIIITNGIISQIGSTKEVAIPKDAVVINCTGKTIIPGMVMLHEHLFYTMMLGSYFNVQEMPYSFPRMYFAGGATTIRTGGSIE
ncbi:MAG: amidohydrolase family protein, partial [Ginsengibacter sp.]